jgi:ketosteroid isomerase-like protein
MSQRFSSSAEAEVAFYRAFERADLEAMMEVWAEDDEVECVHPGGRRLTGLEEIRESWQRLFASGATLSFSITNRRVWRGALVAVHLVYENINSGRQEHGTMIATNVYLLTALGWRMVLHHATPAPDVAELPDDDTPPARLH